MYNHSILLLGDPNTGKTQSIRELLSNHNDFENDSLDQHNFEKSTMITSTISLYTSKFNPTVSLTLWDCNGKINNFNYFMILDHISTCIIFCNLLNSQSCDKLDYWKTMIIRSLPNVQIIVAGTYINSDQEQTNYNQADTTDIMESKLEKRSTTLNERQIRTINKNKLKVLEWCVQNNDIPFFEINLNCPEQVLGMYSSISENYRLRRTELAKILRA